jgi:hypothetical protein
VNEIIALSPEGRTTAGILLLTILAVESGGLYMLRIVRRKVDLTGFQQAFARAGHAHAGVLVIFGLVAQILADNVTLDQPLATIARSGVPLAAILMSAGFFLSSAGQGRTQPNALIWLVYAGALSLAAGVVALGIGLLAP